MELIVASIISLIVLICFFVLCSNVVAIKKLSKKPDYNYWVAEYNKAFALGRRDEAIRALEEMIYHDVKNINYLYYTKKDRISHYQTFKDEKYRNDLKAYNMEFPDFEKLIQI